MRLIVGPRPRDNESMLVLRHRLALGLASCLALGCAACSPPLNWREARLAGAGATALLPCRSDAQSRRLPLAGRTVAWTLRACSAGDATWAVAFADMGDPAAVAPALRQLREAAARNLGDTATPATMSSDSRRLRLEGQLPDGRAVQELLTVFARGTTVFQLSVIGPHVDRLPADALDTFFASLRTAS
jgi:hypothetical protein